MRGISDKVKRGLFPFLGMLFLGIGCIGSHQRARRLTPGNDLQGCLTNDPARPLYASVEGKTPDTLRFGGLKGGARAPGRLCIIIEANGSNLKRS